MKNLPNIITLGNLFCGCIAIAFILHWQPFIAEVNNADYWISGTQQVYLGSIFILIAGILDLMDGAAARWLGVESPIGKDLDSLADVISFGVAPSMILFKLLWAAWMRNGDALDISMLAMSPAFLLACFAAYRLAKFNNAEETTTYFTGVPTPAIGLTVAAFPFLDLYNPANIGQIFNSPWVLYIIIGILCWLMISKFKFFTLKSLLKGQLKQNPFQLTWLALSIIGFIFLGITMGTIAAFILYIILSLGMQKQLN